MLEEEELASHELALGGTRPALFPYLGIPWIDFCVLGLVAVEAACFRWQFLIPVGAAIIVAVGLYRRDYNAGRCFLCWCETSVKHLAAHQLGGTFISPRPGRGYRGIIPV